MNYKLLIWPNDYVTLKLPHDRFCMPQLDPSLFSIYPEKGCNWKNAPCITIKCPPRLASHRMNFSYLVICVSWSKSWILLFSRLLGQAYSKKEQVEHSTLQIWWFLFFLPSTQPPTPPPHTPLSFLYCQAHLIVSVWVLELTELATWLAAPSRDL